MAKSKSMYYCKNCGAQSAKWLGRCPECNEWNTFEEEVILHESATPSKGRYSPVVLQSTPKVIDDIELTRFPRTATGFTEFDRVLGGGIVRGSIVLLGGEPGIGKSTLLLQMALHLQGQKVLYVSGEEREAQLVPGVAAEELRFLKLPRERWTARRIRQQRGDAAKRHAELFGQLRTAEPPLLTDARDACAELVFILRAGGGSCVGHKGINAGFVFHSDSLICFSCFYYNTVRGSCKKKMKKNTTNCIGNRR